MFLSGKEDQFFETSVKLLSETWLTVPTSLVWPAMGLRRFGFRHPRGSPTPYRLVLHVWGFFGKKSAQPGDCFRCTVAVANRPTRSLACSLDIREILLQHAQTGTSVDGDAREGFV